MFGSDQLLLQELQEHNSPQNQNKREGEKFTKFHILHQENAAYF